MDILDVAGRSFVLNVSDKEAVLIKDALDVLSPENEADKVRVQVMSAQIDYFMRSSRSKGRKK